MIYLSLLWWRWRNPTCAAVAADPYGCFACHLFQSPVESFIHFRKTGGYNFQSPVEYFTLSNEKRSYLFQRPVELCLQFKRYRKPSASKTYGISSVQEKKRGYASYSGKTGHIQLQNVWILFCHLYHLNFSSTQETFIINYKNFKYTVMSHVRINWSRNKF